MKRPLISFLAALAIFPQATASAAEATKLENLHCLLLMGSLQSNSDPNLKNVGVMGAMYFLGKVVTAEPAIDLQARLVTEAAKLRGQPSGVALQRCIQEFNTRAQQLVGSNDRLQPEAN